MYRQRNKAEDLCNSTGRTVHGSISRMGSGPGLTDRHGSDARPQEFPDRSRVERAMAKIRANWTASERQERQFIAQLSQRLLFAATLAPPASDRRPAQFVGNR